VPAADLAKMEGLQWEPRTSTYPRRLCHAAGDAVLHRVLQQGVVQEGGITTVPTDWTPLLADCKLLKAKGIQPWSTATAAKRLARSSTLYDMSYLMIGAHSLAS